MAEQNITEIKDTDYITVKRDDKGQVGIFVGGKLANQYRGQEISEPESVKEFFALLQTHNPQITEFHAGAFATVGEYAKAGNPDAKFGPNAWCRVVSKKSPCPDSWVFDLKDGSAVNCATYCAYYCLGQMCANHRFRRDVLSLIDKKSKDSNNKPMSIKLPHLIITIEKRNKQM